MRIYDVSIPLSGHTPTYPGDPGIEVKQWLSLAKGDPANVSVIHFGAHTGTHVDAPAHFIAGAPRLDSLPLEILIGDATVVEIPDNLPAITRDLVAEYRGNPRILFKTRNSRLWKEESTEFQRDYVYLEPDAARELLNKKVQLVGIDYLSVEKFRSDDFETHHLLLGSGVVIIEGLDLSSVPPGDYELICLPLKVVSGHGDGAPARAVLRTLRSKSIS